MIQLPPDLVVRDQVRRRLARLSSVGHPGLVPIASVTAISEGLLLAYVEPVDAVAWSTAIRLRRMPEEQARLLLAGMLRDVSAALVALHDHGFTHGALDGANVLVDPRGTAWLTGVGSAWSAAPLAASADDWAALAALATVHDVTPPVDVVRALRAAGSQDLATVMSAEPSEPSEPAEPAEQADRAARCAQACEAWADQLQACASSRTAVPSAVSSAVSSAVPLAAAIRQAAADPMPAVGVLPAVDVSRPPRPSSPAAPRNRVPPTVESRRRWLTAPGRHGHPLVVIPLLAALLVVAALLGAATLGRQLEPPEAEVASGRVRGADTTVVANTASPTADRRADPVSPNAGTPGMGASRAAAPSAALPDGPASDSASDQSDASAASRRSDTPSSRADPRVEQRAESARQVRAALVATDRARAQAFETGRLTELARHILRNSPAWKRDSAAVAALTAAGLHAEGLHTQILELGAVEIAEDKARVVVTDRRSGYGLVDHAGRLVSEVATAERATWVVGLQRVPDGWRVVSVTAVPD